MRRFVLALLLVASGTASAVEVCDNFVDDDQNGLRDCGDPDCA